ncbi:hypothetical protein [Streptomyces sp. NPDC048392]|uniref:hypothetical protein n=1 Tax=Streptomyces sp. NPDC048392 TaxID=3365543 RepID=UPI003720FC5C
MADVWVATNLVDDGKRYRLIRADDLRHLQLVGDRPRLIAEVPGGQESGWVPLVDSREPYARFSGTVDAGTRPPLPEHFHLELLIALDDARLRVRDEGRSLVVRAVTQGGGWVWRADYYAVLLGAGSVLAEVSAPHAAAS